MSANAPKRVVHLIAGLNKGGAETMLYQLLKYRTEPRLAHSVLSLGAGGYYEEPMRALDCPVETLPLRKRPLYAALRIWRACRDADTLCCWMYHANLLGFLIGRAAGVPRIVWCIRHSNLEPALNKGRTLRISAVCARLSRRVDAIVYNGERARTVHEAAGYCRDKGVVLDNGCDMTEYAPRAGAGERLRAALGLPADRRIILSLTRDHPIKDIPCFIRAFGTLPRTAGAVAVICGAGVDETNAALVGLCHEQGLRPGQDVFLLGLRHDVPELLAACDLYVLHSAGEAFPNGLLQAMACGCVCLSTDVGVAGRLLGRADCVVPAGDSAALGARMQELLALPAEKAAAMGAENRARVLADYDIHAVIRAYEGVL